MLDRRRVEVEVGHSRAIGKYGRQNAVVRVFLFLLLFVNVCGAKLNPQEMVLLEGGGENV